MNTARLFPLALLVAALAASSYAAAVDEHAGHHPEGVSGAAATKAPATRPRAEMRRMDAQTDAMKAMHEKMMAAKTPEEKSALMEEHMKTMGAGMSMMKDMPMGMGAKKGGMAEHHAMMESRMAMMGAAMEMMSDRLPLPSK